MLHSARTPADAERELLKRQSRVEAFAIKPLSREDAERFGAAWRSVQAQFVDDRRNAVVEADRLIGEVMRSRGYPLDDPNRGSTISPSITRTSSTTTAPAARSLRDTRRGRPAPRISARPWSTSGRCSMSSWPAIDRT